MLFSRNSLIYIAGCIILIIASSCVTGSYMQTAIPLEKGKSEVTTSLSSMLIEPWEPSIPGASIIYRRGISKKADIGIGYYASLWGQFRFDYKQLFWTSKNEKSYLSYGLALEAYLIDDWAAEKDVGIAPSLYYTYEAKKLFYYAGARTTFRMRDIGGLFQYYSLKYDEIEPPKNSRLNNIFIWSSAIGVKSKRAHKRVQFFGEIAFLYSLEFEVNKYYDEEITTQFLNRRIYRSFRPELSIGMKF